MFQYKYFFFIFILTSLTLGFIGCGQKPRELSTTELTTYLEKKYNETFTLKSSQELSSNKKGTDTLYTFESSSGITCHISKVYSGGFIGYHYSYSEDYPVMYIRKKPELVTKLMEGDFEAERIDTDDHYCFESKYILYINSYKQIETSLDFIDNFLKKAEAVPDTDYNIANQEINQIRPDITVGIQNTNTTLEVYYHYPTKNNSHKNRKEDFLEHAQNAYVTLVREGRITETLPNNVLAKHPASAIHNITYRDETVIDCMVYRKQNSEYCIEQSCTVYMDCPFYPDKLDTILTTLGWKTTISKRSIIWSSETDEVELCLKGYGLNHTQLHCFKNGKEYPVCGQLLWQSGTNPIITLTESDLNFLFGMTFKFNQEKLTGELFFDNE